MKIRFGMGLDNQRGWHTRNTLGEITVGEKGMLSILETQLGLIRKVAPQSRRIVQYLTCLKQCDHAARFYHQSLEADELGTAATLLGWRDQWYLYGWDGKIEGMEAKRLADMSEVESIACKKVAPSEGERLAHILQAMKRRIPAISSITLTRPLAHYPKRWQLILSRLQTEFQELASVPHAGSFLHTLQDRLRDVQSGKKLGKVDRLDFKADGSVIIARAETRILAAHWLADRMAENIADGILVATDSTDLLDDILAANQQARHGLNESSSARSVLQLLPMALTLLWAPLDFTVLISFLNHPISPIRHFARRQLAEKLAAYPGIRGQRWTDTLNRIDAHYGDQAAAVREQIHTWIDHPRFDQKGGVSIDQVLIRAQKMADYFRVQLTDTDETKHILWDTGLVQTTVFIQSLEQLQEDGVIARIRPRQLQKLLAQATAQGSVNPNRIAEVGSLSTVDDLGALIESFDQVIWWQPVMPNTPKEFPWSALERHTLARAGVMLPDHADVLGNLATDWLKPVLAARKQLIIVLPPQDVEAHPTWQMMLSQIHNITEQSIEQVFNHHPQTTTCSIPLPHTPLPQPRRWWQLSIDTPIGKHPYHSYSSLELFLFNPYQWLLRYPAGLETSSVLAVSDGFLLDGRLAHTLIEHFFALPAPLGMTKSEISTWFDRIFPEIIEAEGAVLLMHGRRSDYEELRYRLHRAITTLLTQIKTAGVTKIKSEQALKGQFPGGKIIGYADLMLTNGQGQHAIVDMKWGGTKKFTEQLRENTHLQLGIYAELVRQKTGAWPAVGYYVLSEAKLIAQQDAYFPDAIQVNKKTEESIPHLWERLKETYIWRDTLLQQGRIEVALADQEEIEAITPPEAGLKITPLNPCYNDYRVLAGWRPA
ncbi:PD-(D/E)XK nuclease superfamily protein [Nitrosomonas cryotolerans]|uniref:PD-(D/E)XK nuclease family protein n=1 Tax=Nitrosomonas cryotolerans TaxID=44575 RepID=UPI0008E5E621|nr:PD-(D/E)XK nuclease family protein [Nitrosomonas cryotolerans]SFP71747.1 PD-(D/E)XK nuclease superfamily protein [Nitrosomonas cryotolerans]